MIPLVDLKAQYESLREEINAGIQSVLDKSAFVLGEEVQKFEKDFAAYCSGKVCVGVGNGTDALYLTLKALGIGPGDEVITVSHTFIATAEAISLTGAQPVFVDIREDTMLMNADLVEAAITKKSRAILPVHLYGQPCDMKSLSAIAKRYNLWVIQDAAQAHGAFWQGQPIALLGDATCFSFYPAKNLGAYGDGGAVLSKNEELISKIRKLANHGRVTKYSHELVGVNSRLDSLQAAVLRIKLRYLNQWNEARCRLAASYLDALKETKEIFLPSVHKEASSVWHLFVVRIPKREDIRNLMKEHKIETGIHYPVPVHQQPAYQGLRIPKGSLPVTEKAAAEVLSLPLYPELLKENLEIVAQTLKEVLERLFSWK